MRFNNDKEREKYFEDGELTQLAEEQTYLFDYEDDDVYKYSAKYIEEISENNFFVDYLKRYIATNKDKINFCGDIESLDDIFSFLKTCYAKEGIKGDRGKGKDSYNPSLVKKWIYEGMIPSRTEAHRLCFCLEMDIKTAEELLLKGCMMKPFNYKDIEEATYYYALNNNLRYSEALEIISIIDNSEMVDNISPENDTVNIRASIKNLVDKDEFIKYINMNKMGFAKQSRKAIAVLKQLIEESVIFAEWEREKYWHEHITSKIESTNDLPTIMNVILGYEARAQENKEDIYKIKIAKSKFPSLIRNNFPDVQTVNLLLKTDTPSVEALRKAIILFAFYNYFTELNINKIMYDANKYNEFVNELDAILAECGYLELYWRNPYDWMFGYCAGANSPVDELRNLIQYFYSDNPEVFLNGDGDLN